MADDDRSIIGDCLRGLGGGCWMDVPLTFDRFEMTGNFCKLSRRLIGGGGSGGGGGEDDRSYKCRDPADSVELELNVSNSSLQLPLLWLLACNTDRFKMADVTAQAEPFDLVIDDDESERWLSTFVIRFIWGFVIASTTKHCFRSFFDSSKKQKKV